MLLPIVVFQNHPLRLWENSDILGKHMTIPWYTVAWALFHSLHPLSARPVEESFHAKPLANQCQWHTKARTSINCSALKKVLNDLTRAIQGNSVNVTSVCINFIRLKKTFVGATSPWFAKGSICCCTWSLFWDIDLMINSLSMTRMSATISVHARNSTLSKPNKSCSSCYSCSISPSLQFQNDHSHHLQQYLGNTLETIVLLIPKAATAGKVSILWPNHLAGLNGFPEWVMHWHGIVHVYL